MAILCRGDRGPIFGYEELMAHDEPFNKEKGCWSRSIENGYNIPTNSEGINMLTNLKCEDGDKYLSKFTISEIEVWRVSFKN